jgi:tRNA modification GTPase
VSYSIDDPIAALATPMASSALAVIRTSGQGSLALLSSLLKGKMDLNAADGHTLHRCVIRDGEEDVDDVLVSVFKAPRSYTGEDGAEITCHGSIPVIRRIISLLSRSGFRPAGPGEFTQRAFLNGKMDLTKAEAVNEIVRARTDRARSLALQRLAGSIETKIHDVRDLLVDLRAAIEVQLDYPEEEEGGEALDRGKLARARSLLEGLIRGYRRGRIYQEGVAVAIAGATNSGKSSLFNLLLKQDRAIVSEVHGTTRDYLEGTIDLEGVPIRLFDTAGIRDTRDRLETEGIRRTEEIIQGADLVLYMVDSQAGLGPMDRQLLRKWGDGQDEEAEGVERARARPIKVWNKIDLPQRDPVPRGFIPVSSLTGKGIDDLEAALASAILAGTSEEAGAPLIDSERQRALIERALDALERFAGSLERGVAFDLLAVDLSDALEAIGEITGEVSSAEILERMFSNFCVGK